MTEYTDLDKAQWILENGKPDLGWIHERVGDMVYRRRINRNGLLPPWINPEREIHYKTSKTGGIYAPDIHIGDTP